MDGDTVYEGEIKEGFVTCRGLKFPKHPGIIKGKLRGSLRDNTYERKEADAVLRVVREGDRVMELGGGIGFMSTHIAKSRNVESVDVFEANPHLIPYIRSVHAANGVDTVTVHNALLGKRKGKADFYVRNNLLASSLEPRENTKVLATEEIEVRNVKATMSDIKPTVLVCDIEGNIELIITDVDESVFEQCVDNYKEKL